MSLTVYEIHNLMTQSKNYNALKTVISLYNSSEIYCKNKKNFKEILHVVQYLCYQQ